MMHRLQALQDQLMGCEQSPLAKLLQYQLWQQDEWQGPPLQ